MSTSFFFFNPLANVSSSICLYCTSVLLVSHLQGDFVALYCLAIKGPIHKLQRLCVSFACFFSQDFINKKSPQT